NPATVAGRASASTGSTSTAVTWPAVSSRARVNEPRPGPISTTRSSGVTRPVRTIRRPVFASTTKFCPPCFVGRTPRRSAGTRTAPAPSRPRGPPSSGAMPSAVLMGRLYATADDRGSGRVGATPGLETAIGLDPVGHGDLLLAGGEVRAGGEVATARAL